MAAYGQEKYLPDALKSLQHQTFTNWEAIIVDDGSPDGVANVAQSYAASDNRIKSFHTENHGVSSARNFAADKAKGEYIICLDADDLFHPTYLARCIETFKGNLDLKVVYAMWNFFGENTHTPTLIYKGYRNELLNNSIHISAMMKRSDFLKAGGFDTEMLHAMEDWEFWIRALRNYRPEQVYLISDRLFQYRQKKHSRNNSAKADFYRNEKVQQYIFQKHCNTYLSILGPEATSDMLMVLDAETYDLIFNTGEVVEYYGTNTVLRLGLTAAKRLSRNRNFRPEVCMKFINLIANKLAVFDTEAKALLTRKEYDSFRLLIGHPDKYRRRARLTQALMPKNWGKPPALYV